MTSCSVCNVKCEMFKIFSKERNIFLSPRSRKLGNTRWSSHTTLNKVVFFESSNSLSACNQLFCIRACLKSFSKGRNFFERAFLVVFKAMRDSLVTQRLLRLCFSSHTTLFWVQGVYVFCMQCNTQNV